MLMSLGRKRARLKSYCSASVQLHIISMAVLVSYWPRFSLTGSRLPSSPWLTFFSLRNQLLLSAAYWINFALGFLNFLSASMGIWKLVFRSGL